MGLFSSKKEPVIPADNQAAQDAATAAPSAQPAGIPAADEGAISSLDSAHDVKLGELQSELEKLDTQAPVVPPPVPPINPSKSGSNLDRLRQRVIEESTHLDAAPKSPASGDMSDIKSIPALQPIPRKNSNQVQEKEAGRDVAEEIAQPLAQSQVSQPIPETDVIQTPPAQDLSQNSEPSATEDPAQSLSTEHKPGAQDKAPSVSSAVPIAPPGASDVENAESAPHAAPPIAPALNNQLDPTKPGATSRTNTSIPLRDIIIPPSISANVAPASQSAADADSAPSPKNAQRIPKQPSVSLEEIRDKAQQKIREETGNEITQQVPQAVGQKSPEESLAGGQASGVRPIRTFKEDIASVVKHKQTSLVSAISAEEERRGQQTSPASEKSGLSPTAYFILGVSTVLVGIGLVVFVAIPFFSTPDTAVPIAEVPTFIFTESQEPIDITSRSRGEIINRLLTAKEGVRIRLGAITHLFFTETVPGMDGISRARLISAEDFLERLDTHAPGALTRAFAPEMMFGIHEFDGNQPFLIFKTADYENAFAGMLEWEENLNADLAPLFGPLLLPERREIEADPIEPVTETGSQAGSTTASTTLVAETEPDVGTYLFAPPFEDDVIRNIEVRVLYDENGDIALLYGFIDKQTIVMTTNEPTFGEILTRATSRRF